MLAIRARLASFWVGVLLLGCTLDDVDLRGKECPCTGGYVCDTSSGLCVPFLVEGGAAGAGGSAAAAGASGSSGTSSGGTSSGGTSSGGTSSGGTSSGGSPSGGASSGGTSSGGTSSGGTSSGGTSSGGTSSGGTSSGGTNSGGTNSGGTNSGGTSSGGTSSGGTGGGGTGGAGPSCVGGAPEPACDPLTGAGCSGNKTCELIISASGFFSFTCQGPPASAGAGQSCNKLFGPFCQRGLHCASGTNVCVPFCCSSSDCGSTLCKPFNASIGSLGLCG